MCDQTHEVAIKGMIAPVLRAAAGALGWELKIRIKLAETGGRNHLTQRRILPQRLEEARPSSLQQWNGKSYRRKGRCVDWVIVFKISFVLNRLVLRSVLWPALGVITSGETRTARSGSVSGLQR